MSSDARTSKRLSSNPAFARLAQRMRGRMPLLLQLNASDCGAACLAMVLGYYGKSTSVDAVRAAIGGTNQGVTALQLTAAARRLRLRCRGVKIEPDKLEFAPRGTILHWEMNHFVVLDSVDRSGARILDPACGPRHIAWRELADRCTGVALLLEPDADFETGKTERSRFGRYLRWLRAAPGYWPRVVALSLLLQLVALAIPAAVGLTVDKVLPRHDGELLQLIAIAGLVALSMQLLTTFVRASLLLHLRTYLDAHMTLELNEHLLRLPFGFFQQRPAGDLVLRLASGAQIRDVLTASALSAVLDGGSALLYFGLLLCVAPLLAAIALGIALAQSIIVLASGRRQAELMSEQLVVQARLSSAQADALAAIEPIKSMAAEHRIAERWADLYVDVLNSALARGRLGNQVAALNGALGFAGPLALLLTGAAMTLDGRLGTGAMLSLSALGSAFLTPVGTLCSMWTQLQSLRSYIQRVDDILDTPREQHSEVSTPELTGAVQLREVSFAYAQAAPQVIEGVSLEIAAGEFVGIVGASGSGKSTLARLLAGLVAPSSGRIAFDGLDIEHCTPAAVRGRLGIVTQDPRLLAATIRDNIALFDTSAPLEQIESAARLAEVHEDVARLPMGYDTVLSDGGGSLSGGQRQRLALARALLQKPAMLVLDEATSQLDTLTERRVQQHLGSLRCTRIVIAHRLSTVRDADRIVVLEAGRIVDVGRHAELVLRCATYRELVNAQGAAGAVNTPQAVKAATGP